jgi:hypothetical protein
LDYLTNSSILPNLTFQNQNFDYIIGFSQVILYTYNIFPMILNFYISSIFVYKFIQTFKFVSESPIWIDIKDITKNKYIEFLDLNKLSMVISHFTYHKYHNKKLNL